MTYYNDNDRQSAAWLRELVEAGMISPGDVDERSIKEVKAHDVKGYERVHLFAGIGGWDYALELAGWPSDRDVWTGSCPCQPLSGAGKRKGEKDERHLWPEFYRLISKCHPSTVFGEQVASRDGREWITGVRADLEALGYAVGIADLCAASEGAPHIRQRLYWVADRQGGGRLPVRQRGSRQDSAEPVGRSTDSGVADSEDAERGRTGGTDNAGRRTEETGGPGGTCGMGDTLCAGCEGSRPELPRRGDKQLSPESGGGAGRMANAESIRRRVYQSADIRQAGGEVNAPSDAGSGRDGSVNFWSNSVLIPCGDGKARRIEPGISPLVNGLPGRVGLLRGYGNAIVPQVAARFIRAFLDLKV